MIASQRLKATLCIGATQANYLLMAIISYLWTLKILYLERYDYISEGTSHISERSYLTSDARYHTLNVRNHTSDVIFTTSDDRCHTSQVRYHTSEIRCHTSKVRCHTSEVRYHTSLSRFQTSDVCFLSSEICFQTSVICYQILDFWIQVLEIYFQDSELCFQTSNIFYLTSETFYLTSDIFYPSSYIFLLASQVFFLASEVCLLPSRIRASVAYSVAYHKAMRSPTTLLCLPIPEGECIPLAIYHLPRQILSQTSCIVTSTFTNEATKSANETYLSLDYPTPSTNVSSTFRTEAYGNSHRGISYDKNNAKDFRCFMVQEDTVTTYSSFNMLII